MKGHHTYLITVNRRMARTIKAERARGKGAFAALTGPIMAFEDFLNHLFSFQRVDSTLFWQLNIWQERMLWAESMSSIHTLGFSKEQTIDMARDAYALMKAYLIKPEQCQGYKEDGDLFIQAMYRFEDTCRELNAFSNSRFIEILLSSALTREKHIRCEHIIFEGFDEFTPAQLALIDQIAAAGVSIEMHNNISTNQQTIKTAATDWQDELTHAAHYAKAMHEQGKTMAIVVPQLQAVWHDVERHMSAVFKPSHFFPGVSNIDMPYNISSGASLSKQPIIFALLKTLECVNSEIDIHTWSILLHSPFLKGGVSESRDRALFDLKLREKETMQLSIRELKTLFQSMPPIFEKQLQDAAKHIKQASSKRPMQEWMIWLKDWIALWGFAQERTVNSAEYQAVQMMYDTLPQLYSLDSIENNFSVHEFIHHVHFILKETIFQIETQDKPIQVLGLLEAAGLSFDHLWIVGLTAEAFPAKTSPHPFIPAQIQIKLNMPHSSPTREVEVAQRLLNRLIQGAEQVILSYAKHDETGEMQLESPLISHFESKEMASCVTTSSTMRDIIAQCQHLETYEDERGLSLTNMTVKGGSALFKDQSACPHRAYLKHRLSARAPLDPVMGLSARAQGMIIHRLFENIWREIQSQTVLKAMDEESMVFLLEKHIEQVLSSWKPSLSLMNQSIEAKRLFELSRAWLSFEKERASFHVDSLEKRLEAHVCGLTLNVTIDRIDHLGENQLLLIDYKTGNAKKEAWEDDRMDEPQLPLYAAVMDPMPQGIAFATLQKNNMRLTGTGTVELSDIKPLSLEEWEGLIQSFKTRLSDLAEEVKAGYAEMAPKRDSMTCSMCELQSGCRLYTGGVHGG